MRISLLTVKDFPLENLALTALHIFPIYVAWFVTVMVKYHQPDHVATVVIEENDPYRRGQNSLI